jgi:mannitol/fructose-specific phosphotransferase system IIA component (Ntr-type)
MIAELLAPELLLAEFEADTKDDALAHLARTAAQRHPELDGDVLLATLREREAQASTALGDGVAIPHARIPGLQRMIAAFARSSAGVEWDAPDGSRAHLIFLLAGPAAQPGSYLKALAAASRLLRDRDFRARLMAASSRDELLRLLREEEARNGNGAAAA